jgi:hypothetical protein
MLLWPKAARLHGVVWVTDEIQTAGCSPIRKLIDCLNAWLNDPLVRLPAGLLESG